MKRFLSFLGVMFIVMVLVPAAVFAACPDQAVCYYLYQDGTEARYDYRGTIDTPTCYKGSCRPWHCAGNTTDGKYWIQQCIQRFNIKHKRPNDKACVTFPMIRMNNNFDPYSYYFCDPMGE